MWLDLAVRKMAGSNKTDLSGQIMRSAKLVQLCLQSVFYTKCISNTMYCQCKNIEVHTNVLVGYIRLSLSIYKAIEAANLMQHPTDPRWNSLLHLPELCKSCSHHRYSWRWWQEAPHAPSIVAEWPCCETMLLRPDPNEIQVEHWLVRLMWRWWCSQVVKPCINWSRSRSNSKPKFLISRFDGHSNNDQLCASQLL